MENELFLKLKAALRVGAEMRKVQRALCQKYTRHVFVESKRLESAFDIRLAGLAGDGVNLEERE